MSTSRSAGSDERYRRLIERSRVGLFQTGRDGEILWANQAAAEIVGYPTPADFVASVPDIREIYADPARRDDFLREIETSGKVTGFEYEVKRPDGSTRWISVSATPMESDDHLAAGFEGSVVDITESRLIQAAAEAISSDLEPEEAIRRFAHVLYKVVPFQQLTLAALEGDRYRRLVSISTKPGGALLPAGEWVPLAGNPTSEAIETRRPVVVQDTTAGQWEFDTRLRDAGIGSYTILPLIDEGGVFATFNVGFASAGALDDEVVSLLGRHTAAVAQAVKNVLAYERERELVTRLSELHQQRNQFFAEISHDLRHPLVVVQGIAEILLNGWELHDDAKKRELVEMVARNAHSMSDLLKRDLEVALIESGELSYEMESFDLGSVIEEVAGSFRESETERTVEVRIPSDLPPAFGDRRRQVQILNNLLSNAAKFSPEGTPVTIEVAPRERELEVAIADEGPGIDPHDRERVFRRLERLERKQPGTGLGLYMTHAMVEAQGGRIWVDPTTDRGARFVYTVPVASD